VTSGTMESYTVDIWSGNHPFYTKSETAMLSDDGRVSSSEPLKKMRKQIIFRTIFAFYSQLYLRFFNPHFFILEVCLPLSNRKTEEQEMPLRRNICVLLRVCLWTGG
jgi:hypothetical protein